MNSPVFYIGIIFLLLGISVLGGTYAVYGSQLSFTCPVNTATIQINAITASPNPVGTGQAFKVSGSMFAGTGCPSSDAGTNYATDLVYWWVDGLSGYSGQFTVNYGGGFSITNIPTISTAGTYTIVVSPYAQNSGQNTGDVCTPTALDLTCTNAETTVTVQSTQATTYPIAFSISPSDPGGVAILRNSANGATQYVTLTSNLAQFQVTAGSYYFSFFPDNNVSVVGTTCLNPIDNTGPYNFPGYTGPATVQATTTTYNCGAGPSNITFNVEPTVSGTVTFNGQTQNIGTNGLVTFSNVPAGTYTALISPSSTYPNCLYNPVSETLVLPYAGGTLLVALTASNSQTCQAPTTATTTATSQSHSSSSTSSGCQLIGNCPPPPPYTKFIEVIQVLSIMSIITGAIMTPLGVFIGSGRKR